MSEKKKEKKNIFKTILAWLKKLFLIIIAFLFPNRQKKKHNNNKAPKTNTTSSSKIFPSSASTNPQDDSNIITNPHDTNTNNEKNIVLKLHKNQKEKLTVFINSENQTFTKEEIEEIIDEVLENIDEHKKQDFKIKKATKEEKEKIKELKEKIIPQITEIIQVKEITTRNELIIEVQSIVKEELKKKPLLPTIEINPEITPLPTKPATKDKESPKETKSYFHQAKSTPIKVKETKEEKKPYVIATPLKISLNLSILETPKPIPITKGKNQITQTTPSKKEEIKNDIKEKPLVMVRDEEVSLDASFQDKVKTAVLVGTQIITKTAIDIISPSEEKQKDKSSAPAIDKISAPDQTLLKNNEQKLDQNPNLQELEKISEEIDYVSLKAEEKEQEINSKEKKAEEKKVQKDSPLFIPQSEVAIATIAATTTEIVKDIDKEKQKEDIEDKDYTNIQNKIDKMLNDIEATRIKYDTKLTESQIRKLEVQEIKLRNSRQDINAQKQIDIENERRELLATISESDKQGLNNELHNLQIEHQLEVNKEVLGNIQKLDNMSKKNADLIEKRLIKKRLRRASIAAEIGSLLTLPFIHNKYFLFLTSSLIIGNHFNFINAILRRKEIEPEELDLSSIKRGEDALNAALNETYDNIDKLAILKAKIIAQHPEMKYDTDFTNTINHLSQKLNKSYHKLTSKREVMERYVTLSKNQNKVLKITKKKQTN